MTGEEGIHVFGYMHERGGRERGGGVKHEGGGRVVQEERHQRKREGACAATWIIQDRTIAVHVSVEPHLLDHADPEGEGEGGEDAGGAAERLAEHRMDVIADKDKVGDACPELAQEEAKEHEPVCGAPPGVVRQVGVLQREVLDHLLLPRRVNLVGDTAHAEAASGELGDEGVFDPVLSAHQEQHGVEAHEGDQKQSDGAPLVGVPQCFEGEKEGDGRD
jgi:hypothetical protein